MEHHDVLVIGGGISGLAFARAAAERGRAALVLEASGRLGGAVHTVPGPDGFWCELGAHTAYNSYGGVLRAVAAAGLDARIRPRVKAPFRLLVDGALRSIPSQLSFWRLVPSLLRAPFTRKDGRTVRSYFSRLVGAKNYARVMAPMLAAVPSQPADDFPATMLFKKRPRDKATPRSFTFDAGLGALVDAYTAPDAVTTRVGAPVTRVAAAPDGGFVVTLDSGERLAATHVAVALPPDAAARLLADAFPDVAEPLSRVAVTTVDSLALILPAERAALPPLAALIPAAPDAFFSVVSRDVVPDLAWRAFTFHFRPGLDRDARLTRACEVLGVAPADLTATHERTSALPSPAPDHPALVADLDARLADTGLALCGAYFAGLALEDCHARAEAEAARVLGPLPAPGPGDDRPRPDA